MRTLLNILWNVPGLGFVAAFCWVLVGVVIAITIIGLPWSKACFTLANYTLAPFGRELASRYDVTGRESLGTGDRGRKPPRLRRFRRTPALMGALRTNSILIRAIAAARFDCLLTRTATP